MPFEIPVAMAVSQCIGVGVCGCPSYSKASIMILDYFLFRNSDPISASSADAVTNLSIWHRVNISPLMCMGCLSCGFHLRKNFPAYQFLASIADK